MIRREGNDPNHYTISRRGKKLGQQTIPLHGSKMDPDEEGVSCWMIFNFAVFKFNQISRFQNIGANEEVIEEEGVVEDDTVYQYIETPEGFVRVERETGYSETVLYR